MTPDYERIVHAYSEAIRSRDAEALALLFGRDAELVTPAGTFRGREEIAAFYRDLAFLVEDLWPEPGPLSIDGDQATVEIDLRMNGDTSRVNDIFTLGGESITRARDRARRTSDIDGRTEKLARGVATRQAAATESDDPSDPDGRSVRMNNIRTLKSMRAAARSASRRGTS